MFLSFCLFPSTMCPKHVSLTAVPKTVPWLCAFFLGGGGNSACNISIGILSSGTANTTNALADVHAQWFDMLHVPVRYESATGMR